MYVEDIQGWEPGGGGGAWAFETIKTTSSKSANNRTRFIITYFKMMRQKYIN
jgi:hypothetical protein